MVRQGFYIYLSSKIPVIMLDIYHRRAAATLGAQRHGDSPTQPALLALGQIIGLVTRQQRPDNPGIFVRDRDRRAVFAATLDQLPYPLAPSVRFAAHPAQRRPRAMDEEFAQRVIAPFAHPQQTLFPARRMLAWYQPEPGGTLPAVLEGAGITDGGHQGRRTEGPNPGNRHQPLTLGMRRSQGFELLLIIGELLLQGGKLVHQLPKHLLAQGREFVLLRLKLTDDRLAKLRHPFGDHDPIFVQQPVYFIHQRCPLAHEPLAHTMECLDVLLVDVFDRHKTHGGPRHRFRDGLGITAVVFVRLDVRLHELRGHELHLVAIRTEASRPVMRAATGFDANAHRGQLRDTGYQVMPGQALAIHDFTCVLHAYRVKHALGDIDPEDVYLVLHGTRLLWLNRFTDRERKDSGTPSCPSEKWDFPKKADITLAYGTDSATTHFRYGVCPSERQECHALLPTDRGTDEAGLYRAQVGSQRLAGPTRTPGATRSGLEGAGGSA